jgi:DNA helicase-2/ATP-dependent DNA helicase PcrA
MRAISLSKLRMQPLSEIIMDDPDFFQMSKHMDELQSIARDYENEKKAMDSLDFDDLLLFSHHLLKENPHILDHYRSHFSDILIDEFQDTDRLQAAFVSLLYPSASQEKHPLQGKSQRNLMVVGDDSQSIYSFRGADIRNMLEFKDLHGAKVFLLTTNYRSSDPIVKLINKCIEASSVKIDKTLLSTGKGGHLPKLMEAANPSEEAYSIAALAEQELLSGSKVGVLFRSAYLASELELELNRRGIVYELRGGLRFAEQAHIKDMLAVLKVHENHKDKSALSRILRLLPGIGEKKADSVISNVSSLDAMLQNLEKVESKKARTSTLLREIFSMEGNAAAILDRFYTSFYREYMESAFDDAEERKPDIDALIGAAAKAPDAGSFLDSFALSPESKPGHDGKKSPDLILSTIHQAKGLEWDCVFVMGLAEGLLPHARSSDIEEERRLFYVAISRAKEKLFLSYPAVSGRFYSVEELRPSRFITELPENSYEIISGN